MEMFGPKRRWNRNIVSVCDPRTTPERSPVVSRPKRLGRTPNDVFLEDECAPSGLRGCLGSDDAHYPCRERFLAEGKTPVSVPAYGGRGNPVRGGPSSPCGSSCNFSIGKRRISCTKGKRDYHRTNAADSMFTLPAHLRILTHV